MKTLIAFVLLSSPLLAASLTGNAGDAVVCKNSAGAITSVESLDLYQGRTALGLTYTLDASVTSPEEILERAIGRFEKVDPNIAEILEDKIAFVQKALEFLPLYTLADLPDYDELLPLPEGCSILQIAQKHAVFDRFLVSKNYWDKMDGKNQSALIMSLAAFELALDQSQTDSRGARLLTAYVQSDSA